MENGNRDNGGRGHIKTFYLTLDDYNLTKRMSIQNWSGREQYNFDIIGTAPSSGTMYVSATKDAMSELKKAFPFILEIKEEDSHEIQLA